jgi:hypothetical protein
MSTRAIIAAVVLASLAACGGVGVTGGSGGSGGDGGPTTFTTSVPGTTTLNQLSGMQLTTLCNDAYKYLAAMPLQPRCRANGVDAASISGGTTDAGIQSACSMEYNQCMQQVPETSPPKTCTVGPTASCMATVSQYAACLNDAVAGEEAILDSMPSCSSLTSSNVSAEVNKLLVSPWSASAACATFRAACPLTTPDLGDLPDPSEFKLL